MAENLVVNEVTYPEVEAISMTNEAGTRVAFYPDAVRYNQQTLTDAQKTQARTNIGAASAAEVGKLSAEKATEGVKAEASRVVNTVMGKGAGRVLRFIVWSDAHQKNDDALITAGNKELGQGIAEILQMIGVDFVANLGDDAWASEKDDDAAAVREQIKKFNSLVSVGTKGERQLWMAGNHDVSHLTAQEVQTLIYSHNKELVQDADHWIEGYGYLDFPNQKVRVICLNTEQGAANVIVGMSNEQLKWLSETALNMEGKTDWSVITMAHHPLSYNAVSLMRYAATTIEAFIKGSDFSFTTNDQFTYGIDYSGRNCQYVGHFHGHTHSFSTVKMQKWVSSGVYAELDAWEIGIPNACYTRNNQYKDNGEYSERYATDVTYDKVDTDGKRTSFNVVTVSLDDLMIYADCFGVGIDREVSYEFSTYVNQIPISTDTDGSIYGGDYNGDGQNDGYKTDTYLSGGTVGTRAGNETTGFIPFGDSGEYMIYLSGIDFQTSGTVSRVSLYTADKTYVTQLNSNQLSSNNFGVTVPYTTGEDGYIDSMNFKAFVENIATKDAKQITMFRLCTTNIDGNSIITVNEPIE